MEFSTCVTSFCRFVLESIHSGVTGSQRFIFATRRYALNIDQPPGVFTVAESLAYIRGESPSNFSCLKSPYLPTGIRSAQSCVAHFSSAYSSCAGCQYRPLLTHHTIPLGRLCYFPLTLCIYHYILARIPPSTTIRITHCRITIKLCRHLSRCSPLHLRRSPLILPLRCIPPITQAIAISKDPTTFLHISPSLQHIRLLHHKAPILLVHLPRNMCTLRPPT